MAQHTEKAEIADRNRAEQQRLQESIKKLEEQQALTEAQHQKQQESMKEQYDSRWAKVWNKRIFEKLDWKQLKK